MGIMGPQPYVRRRGEQGAKQDDRHEAPAEESAHPAPEPVSKKWSYDGAAIRHADRQEEPAHVFHRSRSRTIELPGERSSWPMRSRKTTAITANTTAGVAVGLVTSSGGPSFPAGVRHRQLLFSLDCSGRLSYDPLRH